METQAQELDGRARKPSEPFWNTERPTFFSSADTAPPAPGVNLPAGASAWSTISDRASKGNFAPVDGQALLARCDKHKLDDERLLRRPAEFATTNSAC